MQRSLSTFLSPRVGSGIDKATAVKTVLRNYAQGLLKIKLLRKKHGASVVHDIVCDLSASPTRFNMMDGCCPCITKSRAITSSYHSFSRKRYLDNDDYLALQGVPKSRLVLPPHVSSSQFGGMIGNAMDIQLLARSLNRLSSVLRIPLAKKSSKQPVRKKVMFLNGRSSGLVKQKKPAACQKGRSSGRG